jgi:hypothetical protein
MALVPTSILSSTNATVNMEALQGATGNSLNVVSVDSTRITYRASANFTPQATGAVTIISLQGSATKTVRIKRLGIGGVSAANAQSILQLQRTSALGAGGTVVAPAIALLDRGAGATYAAATAVAQHYTTTLKAAGTGVGGVISTFNLQTCVVTTPTLGIGQLQTVFPEFGAPIGSAIVLRGTADFLEVQNVTPTNLSGTTVLCYFIEWEEDAS